MKPTQKNRTIKTIVFLIIAGSSNAQVPWITTPWPGSNPNWGVSGNSLPALQHATPWSLGGNDLEGQLSPPGNPMEVHNAPNPLYRTTSIGPINEVLFALKTFNKESIFLAPSTYVGIGHDNDLPTAPLDLWSYKAFEAGSSSRLRFFVDDQGSIESSRFISMIFQPSTAFNVEEGGYLNSVNRFKIKTGGLVGINNTNPQAALDVKDAAGSSNFRVYGNQLGDVESTVSMKLHYATGTLFEINQGTPTSHLKRVAIDANGDVTIHQRMGVGAIGGSTGERLIVNAITSDGIKVEANNNHNALVVYNGGGAPRLRYWVTPGTGGTDDAKCHMAARVQIGFHQANQTTSTLLDNNARVNVDALYGNDGVKVTSNNAAIKAFYVESGTDRPFEVTGDGHTHIGVGRPLTSGVAANASLTVDGMILAREIRVATSTSTHWMPDYVFEKDYKLMSLKDVEAYLKKHKHLPGVQSASEVEKDGLDLVQLNLRLLEKVEDLYLHSIALQKQVDKQDREIKTLRREGK